MRERTLPASPRHLCVAAHGSGRGGAEHCLDTTLSHITRTAWRVTAIFPSNGPMAVSAHAAGATVLIRPLLWWMAFEPSLWYLKQLLGTPWRAVSLARWLRAHEVELVYTNTAVIPEVAMAAGLAGIPHVWHVHEILTPAHMRPSLLPIGMATWLIARLSRRIVFESESARAVAGSRIPHDKACVVSNSLRTMPSPPSLSRSEQRTSLGLPQDDFIVLWIGRFSERKQPGLMLEAASRIAARDRTTTLLIGEGPLQETLEADRARLQLDSQRCRILPFRNDLAPLLMAADVLVLTSQEESFGLVLIEAGAAGLPVVSTRAQGPSEIIIDGETGFLVEVGDAAALADRLDQLATNPMLSQRLGAAARRRVTEQYSATTNTALLEDIFRAAIG